MFLKLLHFSRENNETKLAPKIYIIDTADLVYESERVYCKNVNSEVRFKL